MQLSQFRTEMRKAESPLRDKLVPLNRLAKARPELTGPVYLTAYSFAVGTINLRSWQNTRECRPES